MVWAPDSPDLWTPDPRGQLTLGRAVELFFAAKAAEGASRRLCGRAQAPSGDAVRRGAVSTLRGTSLIPPIGDAMGAVRSKTVRRTSAPSRHGSSAVKLTDVLPGETPRASDY